MIPLRISLMIEMNWSMMSLKTEYRITKKKSPINISPASSTKGDTLLRLNIKFDGIKLNIKFIFLTYQYR